MDGKVCKLLDSFFETRADVAVKRNVPLSTLCTLRIGGACDYLVTPQNEESMCETVRFLRLHRIRFLPLGKGSNVLFSDAGYRGVILSLAGLCRTAVEGNRIMAQSGTSVTRLAAVAADAGLCGLAFYYGIPGSVGGAVYMNAGAYDGETREVLESVRCLDLESGEVVHFTRDACALSYRHSRFMEKGYLILSAVYALTPGDPGQIRERMEDLMSRRIAKQPLEFASAGSTFKRYPGRYTAQMIDEAGLKGKQIGDAQVSEKHAGFLINRGAASSADFKELIVQVQKSVFETHGVKIECEVEMIPEEEA